MTETTAAPMREGAMAEVTRDVDDLTPGGRRHRKGTQVLIEDYVSAEESEDGKPFYWASDDYGMNNVCVPVDALAQVMTPDEVAGRRLPTRDEVLHFLSRAGLDEWDGLDIEETDIALADNGTVSLLGTTSDGLPFHAVVSVVRVEHWDR